VLRSYVYEAGCCIASENQALSDWWQAISHKLHADFAIIWPNGHQEIFRTPSQVCEKPSMSSGAGDILANVQLT